MFMTRDMLRMTAQEKLMCASRPTWLRSLCLSLGTRLLVLERRLGQTEETLVAERRGSRRTAEVAQQLVRTCPAGVDWEVIGRLEMFSGDGDLNARVTQHAFVSVETPLFNTTLESSTRRRPRCCSGLKQTWKIRSSLTTRR